MPDPRGASRQAAQRFRKPGKSLRRWPCLVPNIAVGVAPLRDLTGDPEHQFVVDGFTDPVVTELFRRCRGFSFSWLPVQWRWRPNLSPPNPSELKYVVSGSIQQGSSRGTLRANIRISDAVTVDYLWACRQEFPPEDLLSIQTEVTAQISRVLHMLVLHEASRRASVTSDAELGVTECLARANAALKGEFRADLSAKAQKWFLAALARDPRNVEALVGLTLTFQHFASSPWWGDARAAAAASDFGRETVTIALEFEPGNASAKCIQGMLYSAAGRLEEAALAFREALAMDQGLASAHAFGGYNAALLGEAWNTAQAIERAMRLDRTDRGRSIFFFFGGFAELLLGRAHEAIVLLQKSLERNPTHGSAQLFLVAALSLTGQHCEAASMADSFRQQYLESPANAFEEFWLSRSASPVYRAQVYPLFDSILRVAAV
jgi:TolB-like protein/tetratricopeptide (TPR) repeat protein